MTNTVKLANMIDAAAFYKEIDKLVRNHNLSYMDAVIHFCEKNDMEIETAAAMVKSNFRIKSQVREEGETLNLVQRKAKLPL